MLCHRVSWCGSFSPRFYSNIYRASLNGMPYVAGSWAWIFCQQPISYLLASHAAGRTMLTNLKTHRPFSESLYVARCEAFITKSARLVKKLPFSLDFFDVSETELIDQCWKSPARRERQHYNLACYINAKLSLSNNRPPSVAHGISNSGVRIVGIGIDWELIHIWFSTQNNWFFFTIPWPEMAKKNRFLIPRSQNRPSHSLSQVVWLKSRRRRHSHWNNLYFLVHP